jgi:hypothetical protein
MRWRTHRRARRILKRVLGGPAASRAAGSTALAAPERPVAAPEPDAAPNGSDLAARLAHPHRARAHGAQGLRMAARQAADAAPACAAHTFHPITAARALGGGCDYLLAAETAGKRLATAGSGGHTGSRLAVYCGLAVASTPAGVSGAPRDGSSVARARGSRRAAAMERVVARRAAFALSEARRAPQLTPRQASHTLCERPPWPPETSAMTAMTITIAPVPRAIVLMPSVASKVAR